MKSTVTYGALIAAAALAAGCVTTPSPTPAQVPAAQPAATDTTAELFVVLPESGRVHAFGDTKNYFDFLAHGEVQLTRTRIGAGPGGKTLVYGITSADVKANKPSRGEELMEGAPSAGAPFYGEVFKSGRFYLFGDLKDMKGFVEAGEVPYSFTEIGVGPKGETLVYVMNKDSIKKGKPIERKQRFDTLRAKKG